MFHWILANDTCALTLLECVLTGKSKEETFIGRLMGGIYNVQSKDIWIITIILWCVTTFKLFSNINVQTKKDP